MGLRVSGQVGGLRASQQRPLSGAASRARSADFAARAGAAVHMDEPWPWGEETAEEEEFSRQRVVSSRQTSFRERGRGWDRLSAHPPSSNKQPKETTARHLRFLQKSRPARDAHMHSPPGTAGPASPGAKAGGHCFSGH